MSRDQFAAEHAAVEAKNNQGKLQEFLHLINQ
jgi:hypothetical protein